MKIKGFTLVELLAVIVVLAIVLAIAIPSISGLIESSRIKVLEIDADMIERAVILKLSKDEDYDLSTINKSNIKDELDIDGSSYDAIGIENNNGKITVTIVKDDNTVVSSNDSTIINAKVYGLHWDGADTFTRTDDATSLTTVQVGVGTSIVTNNFDDAQIYNEMIEITDSYGNQFIKIPKFYIKKTVNGNAWTWQVSKDKKDNDYYLPACFVDETTGRILSYILVGKYNASLSSDGTRLESKTGKTPLVSKTITEFRGFARANGEGYQQYDIHVVDVLQTLFYIEFATLDSRNIMSGFSSGQYNTSHTISAINNNTLTLATGTGSNYKVGQMIDICTSLGGGQIAKNLRITAIDGDNVTYETVTGISETPGTIATGQIVHNVSYLTGTADDVTASSGSTVSNSNGKYAMKYRGIENFYGNLWQFVDALNVRNNQSYVSRKADTYISNKYDEDYIKVGYINSNVNGYVLKMGFDKNNPFVNLPKTIGSGKYNDYYWQNSVGTITLFGGYWNSSYSAGISRWILAYESSKSGVDASSRLVKTP